VNRKKKIAGKSGEMGDWRGGIRIYPAIETTLAGKKCDQTRAEHESKRGETRKRRRGVEQNRKSTTWSKKNCRQRIVHWDCLRGTDRPIGQGRYVRNVNVEKR